MNYLAHALTLLDCPYRTAGVAVPDWLGLTRPRLRCRSRHAAPCTASDDALLAAVAEGVMRHHADDDWFHQTGAFGDVSLELARRLRRLTEETDGMRPGFVGHILLEMLLDAALVEEDPDRLDRYYGALAGADPHRVAAAVGHMTGQDATQLASIIERFAVMKFLYDYMDDGRLLMRLNQVMRRVGLAELPASVAAFLPGARELVSSHREELLTPPGAGCDSQSPLLAVAPV